MASYADERKAAIRSRNEQSRRRAKAMELRIAKELLGHRIPMSGAGALKGDCEVVTDKVGRVYIECKYSGRSHPTKGPYISLSLRWLDKMEKDCVSMRASFPALIFRYHGQRLSDYVIMPVTAFVKYADVARLVNAPIIDIPDKHMSTIYKKDLDVMWFNNPRNEDIALLYCNRGQYAIMALDIFKEIIHGTVDFER